MRREPRDCHQTHSWQTLGAVSSVSFVRPAILGGSAMPGMVGRRHEFSRASAAPGDSSRVPVSDTGTEVRRKCDLSATSLAKATPVRRKLAVEAREGQPIGARY